MVGDNSLLLFSHELLIHVLYNYNKHHYLPYAFLRLSCEVLITKSLERIKKCLFYFEKVRTLQQYNIYPPLQKGKGKGIGFTSDILLTAIHPTLQGFILPSWPVHFLSPAQFPGEDTVLFKPQLIILTRLLNHYCLIARCQFI